MRCPTCNLYAPPEAHVAEFIAYLAAIGSSKLTEQVALQLQRLATVQLLVQKTPTKRQTDAKPGT